IHNAAELHESRWQMSVTRVLVEKAKRQNCRFLKNNRKTVVNARPAAGFPRLGLRNFMNKCELAARFLAGASAARPIGFGLHAWEKAGQAEVRHFGPAIDAHPQPERSQSAIGIDVE